MVLLALAFFPLLLSNPTMAAIRNRMPELCVTTTGDPCVFPFTYKVSSVMYPRRDQDNVFGPWFPYSYSLTLDSLYIYINFTNQGVDYLECTFKDSPTPWCATMVDFSGTVVTNRHKP